MDLSCKLPNSSSSTAFLLILSSTSPSVYVVYTEISAVGECGTVGPTYIRLTLPYLESDISTWTSEIGHYRIATPLDFAAFFSNCTPRLRIQGRRDAHPSQVEYEKTHCHPSIVYPKGLQTVESAWASCTDPDFEYDKGGLRYAANVPLILHSAAALAPVQTENRNLQSPAQTATPVPQASQPLASKTVPPGISLAVGGSAPQTPRPLPSEIVPPKHPSVDDEPGRKTPEENTIDPGSSEDTPSSDPPGSYAVIIQVRLL